MIATNTGNQHKDSRMTLNKPCPICDRVNSANSSPTSADADPLDLQVHCGRCGTFEIDRNAVHFLNVNLKPSQQLRACMSGWLRENPGVALEGNPGVSVLMAVRQPSVHRRAELLLMAIASKWPDAGADVTLPLTSDADNDYWLGATYSQSLPEVGYLLKQHLEGELQAVRAVSGTLGFGFTVGLITPRGHALLEKLRRTESSSVEGFCAMWFDKSVDSAWRDAIASAIADAGYAPLRLDESHYPDTVDDAIIAAIRRCRFVVADFTQQRGGVYFEAGFALGLGKIVVWTVREDDLEKVHFDNRQYNFIVWKPDDLPEFRRRLSARIEALIGEGPRKGGAS